MVLRIVYTTKTILFGVKKVLKGNTNEIVDPGIRDNKQKYAIRI